MVWAKKGWVSSLTFFSVLSSPSHMLRSCPGSSSASESCSADPAEAAEAEVEDSEADSSMLEASAAAATAGGDGEGTTSWGMMTKAHLEKCREKKTKIRSCFLLLLFWRIMRGFQSQTNGFGIELEGRRVWEDG